MNSFFYTHHFMTDEIVFIDKIILYKR